MVAVLIHHVFAQGARVNSDAFRVYWVLGQYGYLHKMVNHQKNLVDEYGNHTNTIEGLWKQAKRDILFEGGCQDHLLQERLDCFAFRQAYMKDETKRFQVVCTVIAKYWDQAKERAQNNRRSQ